MEIFESVIDEIALSGLEGCTTKELWHHLANRKCPNTFPLALDEQAKSYIWSLLLEASSDILNFYVLKNPRQFEDGLLFTYRLVSNSGIRGSCWDYDTREDVTAAIFNDDTNRNLIQIITRYGEDRLVMVAIQEVRTKTLTSPSMDPTYSVNDVQYCALEAVGRARDEGILRSHLTNKYLKIDPRSTFHHVGILQSIGAIIIKAYSKGYQLFLTRYLAYANQLDNEVTLSDKVCNMLLEAPDHCLPESEIIKEFKSAKDYRRTRSKLVNKGLAEIVESADGETRLLKLIKPVRQTGTVNPLSAEGVDLDDSNEQQENGRTLPKHFVVAERLFEMQGYKILDSAGPAGMTQSEFSQSVQGVDNSTKRNTLANLSKLGCAVSILIDDYKVKKYRYISNNQADKSSDISKLKSEAKKSSHAFTLAIRSKNASLIDQTSTSPAPPTMATQSAASPSLETTMTSVASASTEDVANGSIMDVDSEVEGILKNASHDVEASVRVNSPAITPTLNADFHKRHNVKGIPLKKMERINFILECIETEKVVLSKSLVYKKVLEFETQKGFTTQIDRKTLSKLLQSLVDKGMVNVKTIQLAPSAKTEHSIYFHSSVTEAQLAEATSEARALFTVKESTVKKRLAKDKKAQKGKAAEENSDDEMITMPEGLMDLKDHAYVLIPVASRFQRLQHLHLYLWILQYGLPDDAILSSVTFPWISAVSKVDNINNVIRWRTINDNMPLSLLVIIVGVHQQRMPRKLFDFIQRPEIRNLSLRQLPRHIQFYINAKRRDVVRMYGLLVMLEEMRLAVIHQPTGQLIKINVEVELLRSCSVLDTSKVKARHSFFLEECRSQFNSITFQFDSLKDLQAYWFKLKFVCTRTKIYRPRGDELPDDDEYALHMSTYRKVPKDYNKLGFGAGGLIPQMYSHILYNWGTMTFFKSEQELQDSTADNKPILPEITYADLAVVLPDESHVNFQYNGRRKRKLLSLEGGNATISAAKRVKKAASQKVHKKKTTKVAITVKRTTQNKLVVWSKSEDGVLMRCHVALCVLNAHSLPIPTPVEMCEIIRDWIIPHRFKHAITTQKHMNNICSQDGAVRDQLKLCVDELLQTIKMGGGPPLNFKSLLHYLIDNYTGCVPVFSVAVSSPTTPPTLSLPTTLQLLKHSCEVCAPHETGLLLPPVHTVANVRKSMLVDLIIAVMGAGSECYSEYTAFHLFEEYLEQELEDVIAVLRSAALVKQRRVVDGASGKHLGPSSTQSLMLQTNFYSRLESSFPCHLFEDICTYSTNLGLASTELTSKEEDWMPSGGEVATKLNGLASSAYFCSSATDSFMSNLASLDVELSSCYFVGKQSLPDVPQLDDEDDDCEDDDKENTIDERKITACLPYHISIPLPNNRNFCNQTFRHGYSVGSLLACDSSNASPYPSDGLTEVQGVTDDSDCVMDNMEHDEELSRECVLDSAGPTVVRDKADDSMEHDVECDMEHGMHHTLDSAGPTVEHTQRYTTDHSQGQTKDVTNDTKCDPQLSIDEYLQLCVKHLNYSEYDVIFAKYLYDIIYHAGVMGVSQLSLEQLYQIGITMTTVEHLQQLKNFEMVIEVGVQVVSLVAAEHKRVWLLHMKKQHSPDDQQFTKCRPWTSLHGQEFTGMYQKMQDAVLFYIMDYPGVTLHALERKFTGTMQLNSLRDILEVLIASGCISCHRMIRQRSCDLFTSSQAIVAPSSLHDDIPSNIYFEPLAGCELVYSHSLQASGDVT